MYMQKILVTDSTSKEVHHLCKYMVDINKMLLKTSL